MCVISAPRVGMFVCAQVCHWFRCERSSVMSVFGCIGFRGGGRVVSLLAFWAKVTFISLLCMCVYVSLSHVQMLWGLHIDSSDWLVASCVVFIS